jgi:hypothetical protein
MSKPEHGPRGRLVLPAALLFVLLLVGVSGVRAQQIATVTVVGLDYAYQVPAILPAGLTAFAFENQGRVRHEVVIARLRKGATLDSLIHTEPGPTRLRFLESVGILVAEPGTRPLGRLLVELAPGQTYVLYCNFQDALDKPRHMTIGMVASIQVK